jgi:hypothetical protein
MLTYSNEFNLFIYELITNDFMSGTLADYQTKTSYILNKAKTSGMSVLITIPCGTNTSVGSSVYAQFKQYLYDLASQNGYAILDFDNYFGGFTNANKIGCIGVDEIHPNDYGYSVMGQLINSLLLNISENKKLSTTNTFFADYGLKSIPDKYFLPNTILCADAKIKTFNSAGWGYDYLPPMPLINGNSTNDFPKYAPVGLIGSIGNTIYQNTTDWGTNKNVSAIWTRLTAYPEIQMVTTLPTATGALRGHMLLLDKAGVTDDEVYICVALAGGTQAWKKISLV